MGTVLTEGGAEFTVGGGVFTVGGAEFTVGRVVFTVGGACLQSEEHLNRAVGPLGTIFWRGIFCVNNDFSKKIWDIKLVSQCPFKTVFFCKAKKNRLEKGIFWVTPIQAVVSKPLKN